MKKTRKPARKSWKVIIQRLRHQIDMMNEELKSKTPANPEYIISAIKRREDCIKFIEESKTFEIGYREVMANFNIRP